MNRTPDVHELLSAIRSHCLDCSGGSRNVVRDCLIMGCKLRPYRLGEAPVQIKDSEQIPGQISMDALTMKE